MCSSGGGCSMICCILWGLGWWLVASLLLSFCWNKVVTALVTVKEMKFWHALIIVATLAILCWGMCGKCGSKMSCGHRGDCSSQGCDEGYGKDCCPDSLHGH